MMRAALCVGDGTRSVDMYLVSGTLESAGMLCAGRSRGCVLFTEPLVRDPELMEKPCAEELDCVWPRYVVPLLLGSWRSAAVSGWLPGDEEGEARMVARGAVGSM